MQFSKLKTRLFKGVSANLYGQGVNVFIHLAGLPVYLSYWGTQYYGEWLLIFTIPGYLGMADLSINVVAANEVCMRVSQGQRSRALVLFQSAWLLISLISTLILALFFISILFLPYQEWFQIQLISEQDFFWTLVFLILYTAASIHLGMFVGIYRSEGAYARGIFLTHSLRFLEFAAVMIGVIAGGDVLIIAIMYFAVRSVGALFILLDIIHRYRWFSAGFSKARLHIASSFIKPSMYYMAFPFGNAISVQGMVTLVGVMLGSTSVVLFSTIRTLVNFARQLIIAINQSLWPEFSIILGNKEGEMAKALHRRAVQITLCTAVFLGMGLWFTGDIILRTWTGGEIFVVSPFYQLMLLTLLTGTVWRTSSIVPISVNRHFDIAGLYAMASIIAILLAAWLIPVLGLSAIPLSLILLDLIMIPSVLKNTLSILNDNLFDFWEKGLLDLSWLRRYYVKTGPHGK